MHPYRPDLEGRDVSQFTDPQGKRIFDACVAIVSKQGAGFVDYSWQWKDDPGRIVPKISHVREFSPWGWIVGTGIYVEDVRAEIGAITRKLSLICLGILAIIVGLSAYIIWQGMVRARAGPAAPGPALPGGQDGQPRHPCLRGGPRDQQPDHVDHAQRADSGKNLEKRPADFRRPLPQGGELSVGAMPYSQLRERIPDLLAHMTESAGRVKTIVSDLKDFARQNPGEMADWVDLNQIAKKAVGLVANLIKKSAHDFSAEYAPGLPRFTGNAQRMEQVVINLLVNACHAVAGRHKGITVATGYRRDKAGRFFWKSATKASA